MTFHLTRRTAEMHDRATTRVPVQNIGSRPFPKYFEAAYAKAMRVLADNEGRKGKLPRSVNAIEVAQFDDVSLAIMEVISGKMTASKIAKLVSRHLNRDVPPQTVQDRLRTGLTRAGKVQVQTVRYRRNVWSAAQPHIGITERRVMALREVE